MQMTSCALLVDDRVDRDRGLAGLAVADDQLALAAADRHHRVDRLEAGLQRLLDRLAIDDAGRDAARSARTASSTIGPLPSIGWPSALTTRPSSSSPTGTEMMRPVRLTGVAFLDLRVLAEQHRADALFFEVQRDAEDAVRELEHLAGHGVARRRARARCRRRSRRRVPTSATSTSTA